jgi:rRNA-processing protein FCF1
VKQSVNSRFKNRAGLNLPAENFGERYMTAFGAAVERGEIRLMPPQPQKEILKVILDSNALFVPLQFRIDVFDELRRLLNRKFEPILLSPVMGELEILAEEGSPKMRKNACFALKLAEKCKIVEIDAPASALVDEVIVKIARDWGSPVFTNDKQLRKRLRDISVPVIYLRQKSHLEIDGMI